MYASDYVVGLSSPRRARPPNVSTHRNVGSMRLPSTSLSNHSTATAPAHTGKTKMKNTSANGSRISGAIGNKDICVIEVMCGATITSTSPHVLPVPRLPFRHPFDGLSNTAAARVLSLGVGDPFNEIGRAH